MPAFTPQTAQLAAQAATALLRAVPKSQLTRLGLTRAPFLAPLPLAGAALGGAVVAAFVIPQSREWIISKVNEVSRTVAESLESEEEPMAETSEGSKESAPDSSARVVSEVN